MKSLNYTIVTDEIVNKIADEIVEHVIISKNPHIIEFYMMPNVNGYVKTMKDWKLQSEDDSKPSEECVLIDRINPRCDYEVFKFEYDGTDEMADFKQYVLNSIARQRPMSELFLKNYDSPALD